MNFPTITLKPKEEGRLQGGHLWAFSNEIAEAPKGLESGAIADLFHAKSGFLGRGFYNPHSLIAFRIVTLQKDEELNDVFFEKKLQAALTWRETVYPNTRAYRWIYGESDRLPGLLVDRFGDYVVVQAVSAGMERLKETLVAAIVRVSGAKGIVWRTDSGLRSLEGLPQEAPEIVHGQIPERVVIENENGIFRVDLVGGQKTGFYFDQRDNRQALAAYCKGKKVLDAFCYSGGFGIAAARAGAREVVFNDTSEPALRLAEENAALNEISAPVTFVEGGADKLFEHEPPGGPFEVISIDPPAFAKSKKFLTTALKGYEKLNAAALSALPRGGILATSSCSHHVTKELFNEMLRRAARKANRTVRILEWRGQSKDHPVLLSMPETEYLKCVILQVL